jgi:hypothetical protein
VEPLIGPQKRARAPEDLRRTHRRAAPLAGPAKFGGPEKLEGFARLNRFARAIEQRYSPDA